MIEEWIATGTAILTVTTLGVVGRMVQSVSNDVIAE
jgi:hypothetical protein